MTELQKPGALPKRCGAHWTKEVEGCPRGAWDPSSRWNAEILSICLLLNHINQCILSYGKIHVDTTYTLVYYYPQYIFVWHFGIEDPPLRKGCGAQQPYALHQEDLGKLYIIGRSLRRCCQILPAQDMVKAIGGEFDSWRLESSIPLIIHNHHVFEW